MNSKTNSDAWSAVMSEKLNPLRNYPLTTAHMLMQILAWMWSLAFSIAIGSYMAFGISAIAHISVLGALFITLAVFQQAQLRETAADRR